MNPDEEERQRRARWGGLVPFAVGMVMTPVWLVVLAVALRCRPF